MIKEEGIDKEIKKYNNMEKKEKEI